MAAILSSNLFIVRRMKPIFELEPDIDGSNPCMKFERNLMKMTVFLRKPIVELLTGIVDHFFFFIGNFSLYKLQ